MQQSFDQFLLPGERLDDLQLKGLRLIQHPGGYCMTSDSVLLSSFVKLKKGEQAADFCSGSGVVALLAAAKNAELTGICVTAVEMQPRLADMAKRSVLLNGYQNIIAVKNITVQDYAESFYKSGGKPLDVVMFNPPYEKGNNQASADSEICAARCEKFITMDELAAASAKVLRFKGRLYAIYSAVRAAEFIAVLSKHNMQVKTVLAVIPAPGKSPHAVLIEAVKGGSHGACWLPPLYISDGNGNYTEQAKLMYNIAR